MKILKKNYPINILIQKIISDCYQRKLTESLLLKNAEIYIDGFHSFTPQEYMIIEQLMKHCPKFRSH